MLANRLHHAEINLGHRISDGSQSVDPVGNW